MDFDRRARSQPERTRREDRRLKFYGLRDNLAAFPEFVASLTEEELHACPYHEPDWGWAAEHAISLFELRTARGWAEADKLPVDEKHRGLDHEAAWSFFHEPIFVQRTTLGNGQHRVCAMKTAGVPRCLIKP